jgi:ribosomal protein L11 methyltransferase
MPHLSVTFAIGRRDPEPFEALLFELGAASITLSDAGDDPVLEPAPGATPLWPTVEMRALFAHDADPERLSSALSLFAPDIMPPAFSIVADREWEREWLADFKPMRFGRRLWVCPGGQTPPEATDDSVRVELDPGLAFGTGTHPTTALCLTWLESNRLDGHIVVDYGCGSGILAIAALKLGARHVYAVDIDPQAQTATRSNAARNGVSDRLTLDVPTRGTADVLVANILAGPLVELSATLQDFMQPRSELALSGILLDQVETVTAAYRPWFDIGLTGSRDGWALLSGRRTA